MSHDHSQHVVEENPKVKFTAAFFTILIIIALLVGMINFVQSMSHEEGHEGGHGKTAHTEGHHEAADPHSWDHNILDYDAAALAGVKPETQITAPADNAAAGDSTNKAHTTPMQDSTHTDEKEKAEAAGHH